MKIGIYADAHFSLNSSIILGQTNSLEGRLNHLIDSFKWMYELFRDNDVEVTIDLGDLTDSYVVRAEEITAVSKALSFNTTIPEYHILGNHERLDYRGSISSISFVDSIDNQHVVNDLLHMTLGDKSVTLLPYSNGYNDEYIESLDDTDYLFTHLDILGSDTGGWSLTDGIKPNILANKFGLTVNGHIHNGSWVIPNKVLNIGSISGQNFSSKQLEWNPSVMILDTDTNDYQFFENPHALIFVNKSANSIDKVVKLVNDITEGTYAVQLRVPVSLVEEVRKVIQTNPHIVASRIMTKSDKAELEKLGFEEIDHVDSIEGGFSQLVKFIDSQESLPYNIDDIKRMILELEENKLI